MKSNTQHPVGIVTSVPFLIALSLLLANDFIFKWHFHNEITGKLSDLTGMFIFPIFWAALIPRYRKTVYLLCSVFFIYWKSPASQFLIDFWNANTFFHYQRTIDYTDLIALLIVIPAYYFQFHIYKVSTKKSRFSVVLICLVSCFAFIATSDPHEPWPRYEINASYAFLGSGEEISNKITQLDTLADYGFPINSTPKDTVFVYYPSPLCEEMYVELYIHSISDSTSGIETVYFSGNCEEGITEERILQEFEEQIIDRL